MTRRFNLVPLKPRRRQLRQNATSSEQVLWNEIRNKKLGVRFVRQYSIDGYVMDFYSPRAKLGVELEGGIHKSRKVYDSYREKYLTAFGIRIIKFSNEEIRLNLQGVLKTIRNHIDSPSLYQREGDGGEF